ncbi:DUF58 domain-containing protein [Candidatus Nomurabacteria bacterium]|nr:DUF58 domain-containing protein [Candidatus Nomurabacteria bacterium]
MINRRQNTRDSGNRVPHQVEASARIQSSKGRLAEALETMQSAGQETSRFDIQKFYQAQRQIRFSLSQLHAYEQRLNGECAEKEIVHRALTLFSKLNEKISICIELAEGNFTGNASMAQSAVRDHLLPDIHRIFEELESFDFEKVPIWKRIGPRVVFVVTLIVAGLAPNVVDGGDGAVHDVAAQMDKEKKSGDGEEGEGGHKGSPKDGDTEGGTKGSFVQDGNVEGGYEAPDEYEPGIEGSGYSAKVAEVDFSFGTSIDEPLWSHGVYQLSREGLFRKIKVNSVLENHDVQAWVEINQGAFVASVYNLYTPPGYSVDEVEGPPPELGIRMVVDRKNQKLKLEYPQEMLDEFGIPKKDLGLPKFSVRYSVVKAEQQLERLDVSLPNIQIDELQQKTIERLRRASAEEFPDIFDDYIGNFTYVTSHQLQKALKGLPGSMIEKTTLLRIGDCDSLSAQLVYMLEASGHHGYLFTGLLESRDELNTQYAHGKVLYHDKQGNQVTYEATAATRASFRDVQFHRHDLEEIESMANAISFDDPKEARQQTKVLGDKIRSLLENGDYDMYEQAAVPSTFAEMKTSMMELTKGLNDFMRNPEAWKHILGLLFGLLAVGFASIKGIEKGEKYAERKHPADVLRHLGKLFLGEDGDFSQESTDEQLRREIDNFYRTNDPAVHEYLENILPKEKFLLLPPEKQREALYVMRISRYFEQRPFGIVGTIKSLSQTRQMNTVLAQLDAEGVPASRMFRRMKELVTDPEVIEQHKEHAPQRAREIVETALREGSVFVDNQGNLQMVPAEMFIPLGSKLASVSGQQSGSATRRGSGGDFYEHSPYRPGDDLRRVDWKASARRGDYVTKTYSSPEGKNRRPVHIILELGGMKYTDYEKLVGLLAHMQKEKTDVYPKTITLNVCGNSVSRFGSREIAQLMSGSVADIQAFVVMLLKTCATEAMGGIKGYRMADSVFKYLPSDAQRSDWYMVMGSRIVGGTQAKDVDWYLEEQWTRSTGGLLLQST